MSSPKIPQFTSSQKRLAALAKAFGHPARIAIIQILADHEHCICGDITGQLPLAQSTVSQHLKVLKKAGLIKGEIDGVRTCYCLDEKGVAALRELFVPLANKLQIKTEENSINMSNTSKNADELKTTVREKYRQISEQPLDFNAGSCCGAGESSNEVYNIMTDDYSPVEGYHPDADLGLGCGLPTQFAHIEEGDTVIDLGSGAGNDCFVARYETGASGKVLGIDFTESMIKKARKNAQKQGYNNVEFRYGDIEDMPVASNMADVIVSNCVLNLVPDKKQVFSEIFRVLKPGGHFSISDIVLEGELPEALREDAEMYAGCVAGAIQKDIYLGYIEQFGFENITIQEEKTIQIPNDILGKYLSETEIEKFNNEEPGIYSITVFAQKAGGETKKSYASGLQMVSGSGPACGPGSDCC